MKNGITLISVSIVIIVTLILTTAVVIGASNIIESTNKTKFAAEIVDIKEAIQEYKTQNGSYPEDGILTIDLSNLSIEEEFQFAGEKISSQKFQGYLIDYDAIGIENKYFGHNNDGLNEDVYIFSKETGKVYYVKGIEYKGKKYYTATKELVGYEYKTQYEKQPVNVDGILFYQSETEFTSNAVQLLIKVPTSLSSFATSNTSVNGYREIIPQETTHETGYDNYLFNYDNSIVGNYSLDVVYQINEGEEFKTYTYYVDNVDSTPPDIDISNMNIIGLTENGETKKYLGGFVIEDPESGIDTIKYEYGDFELEYFQKYGKILTETNIDITDRTFCTIYVRSKTGQEAIEKIDLVPS